MYSPADLPSSTRAAPAKKRMLSAETGISSFAADRGLPTFWDSSSASSSACWTSASASFKSSSERSPGVVSSHSGNAFFAACTARSTSSADELGTSAMVSPVAGFRTSIVSPLEASSHSPPTRFLCWDTVTLISSSSSSGMSLYRGDLHALRSGDGRRTAPEHARVAGQTYGDRDRDDRQQDHRESDDVHDRELLALLQIVEDEDRQRRLRTCGEGRDDHLVERQRERQEAARNESSRKNRPDDEAERLPAVRSEIHRCLDERGLRSPQSGEHVVVDDDDPIHRVANH